MRSWSECCPGCHRRRSQRCARRRVGSATPHAPAQSRQCIATVCACRPAGWARAGLVSSSVQSYVQVRALRRGCRQGTRLLHGSQTTVRHTSCKCSHAWTTRSIHPGFRSRLCHDAAHAVSHAARTTWSFCLTTRALYSWRRQLQIPRLARRPAARASESQGAHARGGCCAQLAVDLPSTRPLLQTAPKSQSAAWPLLPARFIRCSSEIAGACGHAVPTTAAS